MKYLTPNLTEDQKKLIGRFCRAILKKLAGKSKTKFRFFYHAGLCHNFSQYCDSVGKECFSPFRKQYPFDKGAVEYRNCNNKFNNQKRMDFIKECAKKF